MRNTPYLLALLACDSARLEARGGSHRCSAVPVRPTAIIVRLLALILLTTGSTVSGDGAALAVKEGVAHGAS